MIAIRHGSMYHYGDDYSKLYKKEAETNSIWGQYIKISLIEITKELGDSCWT